MRRLLRSWRARVAVAGHSMEPALLDGDWLLVDPQRHRARPAGVGDVVVARDPSESRRVIVKRVVEALRDGRLRVAGDHPAHGDSADPIAPLAPSEVVGVAWFRYWPLRRAGRVGRRRPTA